MARCRRRSGYTIIGLLVVVIIIAVLWNRGLSKYFVPSRPTARESAAAALPDETKIMMWNMQVQAVRTAVNMSMQSGQPAPKTWDDLQRFGIDTRAQDPWGGKYYMKNGFLKCTGNPKMGEKLVE